jgi:hypothetical protein
MTIQVTLHDNEFIKEGKIKDCSFYNGEYNSLKIIRFGNGRVYFMALNKALGGKVGTFAKQMQLVDGNVIISFGKNDKLIIGTYVDTEAAEETPVIEEVTEAPEITEDDSEVVTVNYSSLNGYGQCVAYKNNMNTNNTVVYFNPKDNESITIPIHHNNYDLYWSVQNFIYSIMKQYGSHADFWSILINELNNKYINKPVKEIKQPKQTKKVSEAISKIDMIADYAQIIYSGNKAVITFTNSNTSNSINFDYKRSWSHRKYIDKALELTGIKPSWEFRYGWEFIAV